MVDLAMEMADQLSSEYPSEFNADIRSNLHSLPPDDAAVAMFKDIVNRLGDRHLLLMMENLDRAFQGLGEGGQKKWRAFLQETGKIATLATTQQLFDGVSKRDEAFFGFFDIYHLQPLSFEDALQLIINVAREYKKQDLVDFLGTNEGHFRIRALRHLAGGNHRMYIMLSEFLTKDSLDELVTAFEQLAEELTPYFQERLRSLPPQQARVVQSLCNAEGALTVKAVATDTFLPEGNCSKHLGELKKKGFVTCSRRGKESYYEMAEPIMRLCLEIKSQRGRPLRLIALFLRAWFPAQALQAREGSGLLSCSRGDSYRTYALQVGNSFEEEIKAELSREIEEKYRCGKYIDALRLADELHHADPTHCLSVKARIFHETGMFDDELSCLSKLIDTSKSPVDQHAKALLDRGVIYRRQGKYDLAFGDYTALIETPDAPVERRVKALFNRAVLYRRQGRSDLAVSDYTALVETPDAPADQRAKALLNRGVQYRQQGKFDLAVSDYTALIETPDAPADQRAKALLNRGIIYGLQGKSDLELSDYTALIETPDAPIEQRAKALLNRGITYGQQGKSDLELSDYTALIEIPDTPADQRATALLYRGITYGQQGKTVLELGDYSTLIETPDASAEQRAKAFFNRGITYGQQGKSDLELSDYTALIETPDAPADQRAKALLNRGVMYRQQGKFDLAVSDYTALIETPDAPAEQRAKAFFNRGITYGQQGKSDLALSDYTALIETPDAPADQRAKALLNRGAMYGRQGKSDLALSDYTALIETPDAPADQRAKALFNRGAMYGRQGKSDLALSDYTALIETPDAPTDQRAKALLNRGFMYGRLGKSDLELSDYTALIETPDAPVDQRAKALIKRSGYYWKNEMFGFALNELSKLAEDPGIPLRFRQEAMFYIPESIIPIGAWPDAVRALTKAFDEGDPSADDYGGTPHDLLKMVLRKGFVEWGACAADLVKIYQHYSACDKLCSGLTQSIAYLDEGDYSDTQLDAWNEAWQHAGQKNEACEVALRSLRCAIQAIKARSDRPLFELPLEIRELVLPLLQKTCGKQGVMPSGS
jgi:tetratricopeptide (TPR) repeat protein